MSLSFLVPGLPHLLSAERSPAWSQLKTAMAQLETRVAAEGADCLVLYSTQWISVLGTSFQAQARPSGVHVDDNWYEMGDLPYGFNSDTALVGAMVQTAKADGFAVKSVDYESFPIDTGSIVALKLLDPRGKLPVALVSSCVYYDGAKSRALGESMRRAAEGLGRKPVFGAVSLLTTRYFTEEMDPKNDAVSHPEDDRRNRDWLSHLEAGNWERAEQTLLEMKRSGPVDGQGNAFHWLHGVLGTSAPAAQVLGYGPLWGTGAAVVQFSGGKA